MTDTLTPGHEPRIERFPRPGYPYRSAWFCACGAKASRVCSSKPTAMLDYWRTHLFPGHREYPHYLEVVPGGIYPFSWKCACGATGEPAGYVDERRMRQSHTSHVNAELKRYYQDLIANARLRWTEDQHYEHRRAVQRDKEARESQHMDRVMAERQRLIQERLDELL